MGLLDGKVAIVTGIGPGIGRAAALTLAREGAAVVLGARTEASLKEVADEIDDLGARAAYAPTNIADNDACLNLVKVAIDSFGAVDVLIQNAFNHGPFVGVADSDPEDWRKVHKVNVMGTLQMIQACLAHMGDGASIVVTASMAARTGGAGFPEGAYAASKAGMLSMVRSLAQEVGPRGIRVNSVLPGWVAGPSLDVYFEWISSDKGITPEQAHDEVAAETCLKRLVTPQDVANAMLFLASPLSNGITGVHLDVNAGHWLPQ